VTGYAEGAVNPLGIVLTVGPTSNGAILSWTNCGAGSYRVLCGTSPFNLIEVQDVNGLTATIQGLNATRNYYFQIIGDNGVASLVVSQSGSITQLILYGYSYSRTYTPGIETSFLGSVINGVFNAVFPGPANSQYLAFLIPASLSPTFVYNGIALVLNQTLVMLAGVNYNFFTTNYTQTGTNILIQVTP